MGGLWTVEIGEPEYLDGIQSGVTVFAEARRPVAYAFRAVEGQLLAAAPALLEVAQLVRMSRGWQYLADETKALIDAAITAATHPAQAPVEEE